MHMAVNGVRPYAEGGGGGAGEARNGPCSDYECNGIYDGPRCIEQGEFNPCSCGVNEGFSNPATPCILNNPWACMDPDPETTAIFKCTAPFTCSDSTNFTGCKDDNRYCQCGDLGCPDPDAHFDCKIFSCSGYFDCPPPSGRFFCGMNAGNFNCHMGHHCPSQGFTCQAQPFGCQGELGEDFVCETSVKFYCDSRNHTFICQDAAVNCNYIFSCMQLFHCNPPGDFDADACEESAADFKCVDAFISE